MAEANLSEELTWAGEWWLPEIPDKTVLGMLSDSPDSGIELRRIGGWESRITSKQGDAVVVHVGGVSWPMIHGVVEDQPITLVDTFPTDTVYRDFRFDGDPDEMRIHAATALFGCQHRELANAADLARRYLSTHPGG